MWKWFTYASIFLQNILQREDELPFESVDGAVDIAPDTAPDISPDIAPDIAVDGAVDTQNLPFIGRVIVDEIDKFQSFFDRDLFLISHCCSPVCIKVLYNKKAPL